MPVRFIDHRDCQPEWHDHYDLGCGPGPAGPAGRPVVLLVGGGSGLITLAENCTMTHVTPSVTRQEMAVLVQTSMNARVTLSPESLRPGIDRHGWIAVQPDSEVDHPYHDAVYY